MARYILHLLHVNVTLPLTSRPSLPEDLRLVAKVLAGNDTIATSEETPMDPKEGLWMLKVKSNVPSERAFSIEISGNSPSQTPSFRFGSIEFDPAHIMPSLRSGGCFSFDRSLDNPSTDLPSLQIRAGFTIESVTEIQVGSVNSLNFPLDERSIRSILHATLQNGTTINSSDLNIVYESIQYLPITNEHRSLMMDLLGDVYLKHYHATQSVDDIHQAVKVYSEAVQDTAWNDIRLSTYLANHGAALLTRFNRLGNVDDIHQSVLKLQEAVQLTPDGHPNKPSQFNNLGISLTRRFERLGDLPDLNESIVNFQIAVHLTPDGHPSKPSRFNNLGISLTRRFERLGDLNDLNESIANSQNAVRLTPDGHPDKPPRLNNLGISLAKRFERLGDLPDLNQSIANFQNVVHLTPDDHPDRASLLNNLGKSLLTCFERHGDLNDLNESIANSQNAVQLTPDDHPDKPSLFNNLGNSLLRRFEQLGDQGDLNESIANFQNAVRWTPDGHPDKPSLFSNLGNSLLTRFQQLGDLPDLNESIANFQNAVQLTPDGHPDKPSLFSNLGNSLLRRVERLGDLKDLNESIANSQNAVQLTPNGHPDKPSWFSNLGNSLLRRFERLGSLPDLNKSIANFRNAVQLTPDGHPEKPSLFNNLGSSLLTRFQQLGDLPDLNESIANSQNAVHLTPDGHLDKPLLFNNLGDSLLTRFERLQNLDDVREALSKCSVAACAQSGVLSGRFIASRQWALCHYLLQSPPLTILEAYQVAMDVLPQLAWLGSSVSDRHHQLITASDMVSQAAAAAVKADHNKLAVEWLEQGRSVIWGQLLQLRTPLDFLKSKHPKQGQRLEEISLQLEKLESQRPVTGKFFEPFGFHASRIPQEELAKSSHDLAYEREQLLAKIRKQTGFERFLLPQPLPQLTPAAHSGPVVMLTLSPIDNRCNALILLPNLEDDVLSITLESFTPKLAKQLYTALQKITSPNEVRNPLDNKSSQVSTTPVIKNLEKGFGDLLERLVRNTHNISLDDDAKRLGIELVPVGKPAEQFTFEQILAELWKHVAKPVLDALAILDSSSSPKLRLWWCPSGILSFLPFHAAGLYGPHAPTGSKLSEFVISSYTPTLTALLNASKDLTPSSSHSELLIVAETSSHGAISLPGTRKEHMFIKEQIGDSIKSSSLTGAQATAEHVAEGMKTASWVHFACHGIQHITQPTESALLLAGRSRLTLQNIMQLKLSHRDVAFLSACQTAKGDEKLSDEAVHLAAGMLMAGYRGVIATMWSVMDQDAPQVARDVYGHLFIGKKIPDPTEAALALHHAVRILREGPLAGRTDNASFLSWVAFIHMGI